MNKKIILIVFIVIILSGIGYMIYQLYCAPEMPLKVPKNETTGWKTYTDNQFGFEFQYPGNWYMVNVHSLNDGAQLLSNYIDADSFSFGSRPDDAEDIFFGISDIQKNLTLDDLKRKPSNDNYYRLVSFEKFMTSSGIEGRKEVIYSNDHPMGNHTTIFFIKNGLEVDFKLGMYSEDQVKLLEQILSTFRFLP